MPVEVYFWLVQQLFLIAMNAYACVGMNLPRVRDGLNCILTGEQLIPETRDAQVEVAGGITLPVPENWQELTIFMKNVFIHHES